MLFNARNTPRKQLVRDLWAELARDEDKEVVFAEVRVNGAAHTQKQRPGFMMLLSRRTLHMAAGHAG